ncbi:hypothetical protein FoTM2_016659 [Fusarium oxysporum f. sp. vasinfectum]|uniref:Uncharacterized protein n=1 Tax=Fusarium oxysporum f. sp. vasinfectum 25433 TaxID=1089449 RepID=X0KZJ5_FUSOX|nr:hypothetical protein FOTG_17484 [Fusarium oxysporum f. sp. vasinfectum 25433]KAK2923137.1 hypothetical protein FoTM2_016659 [Fusarium oxysporum f. sp. vasinfectum]
MSAFDEFGRTFDISELHGARNDEPRIEATGGMAGGVEKQTNKWLKDVDNDKEYSKNEKPARDLLKMKTMMLMNSATGGFNIGYEQAVVVEGRNCLEPLSEFRQEKPWLHEKDFDVDICGGGHSSGLTTAPSKRSDR